MCRQGRIADPSNLYRAESHIKGKSTKERGEKFLVSHACSIWFLPQREMATHMASSGIVLEVELLRPEGLKFEAEGREWGGIFEEGAASPLPTS